MLHGGDGRKVLPLVDALLAVLLHVLGELAEELPEELAEERACSSKRARVAEGRPRGEAQAGRRRPARSSRFCAKWSRSSGLRAPIEDMRSLWTMYPTKYAFLVSQYGWMPRGVGSCLLMVGREWGVTPEQHGWMPTCGSISRCRI